MPEYLAPGVYVEETSFRSKSIEGVATSTTAFVGPTRRGPVAEPELVTSYGDFERIFGGLQDLGFDVNYVAHAVRAYFNEGGSRLYMARAYAAPLGGDGRARSAFFVDGGTSDERALFRARFPGAAGNGAVTVSRKRAIATRRTLETAPPGTLVRVGGGADGSARPPQPARVEGTLFAPFSVANNGVLRLVSGGRRYDLRFGPAPVEVTAGTALPDPVDLTDTNNTLNVTIDGAAQAIILLTGAEARGDFVDDLNTKLAAVGGLARLAPDNRLVLGVSSTAGVHTIAVAANAELGFTEDAHRVRAEKLGGITPGDLNGFLETGAVPVRAQLSPEGRLVLQTVAAGDTASLTVVEPGGGETSVHAQLGLKKDEAAVGQAGATIAYYRKVGSAYTNAAAGTLDLSGLPLTAAPPEGAEIVTMLVSVADADADNALVQSFEDVGFDRAHPRFLGDVLPQKPRRRAEEVANLAWADIGAQVSAFELHDGLFPGGADERIVALADGDDGTPPAAGTETQAGTYANCLAALARVEDISIVAAPGHSSDRNPGAVAIQGALISHAEARNAFRIAVLDTAPGLDVAGARLARGRIDSKYAALYYPWVKIDNPLARPGDERQPREIAMPPSGFICGIYARNDIQRGVHKAPANEVVRSAIRFEREINFGEQEVLNPLGVNCLRFFVGRGYRVWGARTASSDSEFRYVSDRRYFNYLEASVFRGSMWAVFEPNGPRLWANVREMVSNFLYAEWRGGALLGATPEEAFFVRCDRSTMTQQDLDSGRLVCEIGVALVKPAEFVIFRIGQKTADART
jgi:phage tail sheath protein FI